jgi:hypothetical protein
MILGITALGAGAGAGLGMAEAGMPVGTVVVGTVVDIVTIQTILIQDALAMDMVQADGIRLQIQDATVLRITTPEDIHHHITEVVVHLQLLVPVRHTIAAGAQAT